MIVCAGENENFEFANSIGVGLVNSAIKLTKFCTLNPPKNLLFIGSCGLYKDGNIFDIFTSCNGANIELSNIENNSYTPFKQQIINSVSCETYVNSSTYITTNKHLAHKIFNLGYKIENMEFYSVLAVGSFFKIPVNGIFVATNFCDQNAHKEFLKNHQQAKEILIEHIKNKGII